MKKTNPLWLLTLLVMLPQFVETIYSPVLPMVQQTFGVNEESTTLTISLYFIAFALGVAFWGIQCDRIGRKKSLEYGLITYGIGTFAAIFAPNFMVLLAARIISAFGISVGSIVTQTILRDTYDKDHISKVFSWIGIGLSISPVIGMTAGSALASSAGHQGVFITLYLVAVVFYILSRRNVSETHHFGKEINFHILFNLLKRMLRDREIIRCCLLVMSFNVLLFSYYSLAPFIFKGQQYSSYIFGYSSIILAAGTFVGAKLNRFLLLKNIAPKILVTSSVIGSFVASVFVWILTSYGIYFLAPYFFIVMAFSMAIPNILSTALIHYKNETGSAGALLGLIYYVLIGSGLISIGFIQNLGISCVIFSGIGVITLLAFKSKEKTV
ncbi:MFS transporter [Chryseobacterium jejuense]|uniref:Inner membrane transport protein ydhC n=1 Tax=Chryseobacterium jejuense TaxID=445960 RepID=A0A2X2ZAG3_CHRJE|nr:MFS transporter [Chryseobacterium jejuense]SDI19671.1 Predicted arabinose efflux permease, MFS family [Chryseobacterium jejuense]SQB46659.1 Inner membrane transport protein ydhC [Chryseobacterium jejuense]